MSLNRLFLLTATTLLISGVAFCTDCDLTSTSVNGVEFLSVQPNTDNIVFHCNSSNTNSINWCNNNKIIMDTNCPAETNCLNISSTTLMTSDKTFIYCTIIPGPNPCLLFEICPSTHTPNDNDYHIGHVLHVQAIRCSPLANPQNGYVTYSVPIFESDTIDPLPLGTTASYECHEGFSKSSNEMRVCVENSESTMGVWNGTTPTCEAITCQTPDVPPNGSIDYYQCNGSKLEAAPDSITAGMTVRYECDTGFAISGGTSHMTCQANNSTGKWSQEFPNCLEIVCSKDVLINGTVSIIPPPTNGDTVPYGSIANYTCNKGYSMVGGSQFRTCSKGHVTKGEWEGKKPTCQAIRCSPLANPQNGYVTYNVPISKDTIDPLPLATTATHWCHEGFSKSTNETRMCVGNSTMGVWNGTAPTCNNGHSGVQQQLEKCMNTIWDVSIPLTVVIIGLALTSFGQLVVLIYCCCIKNTRPQCKQCMQQNMELHLQNNSRQEALSDSFDDKPPADSQTTNSNDKTVVHDSAKKEEHSD